MKKIIIAGSIGGIVLTLWGFVAWMGLNFHGDTIRSCPDNETFSHNFANSIKEEGVYVIPAIPDAKSEDSQNIWQEKIISGPIVTIFFRPTGGDPTMITNIIYGTLINMLVAMLVAWILSRSTASKQSYKILALPLLLCSLNTGLAQRNISGIVENVPDQKRLKATVNLINKNNGSIQSTTANDTGYFNINTPNGTYRLEVIADNHYIYRDTSVNVSRDTSFFIQPLRGYHDNGTPVLICPLPQYRNSMLRWGKTMLARRDNDLMHDVTNWSSNRRRLYVTGINDSISNANLNRVISHIQDSTGHIIYDRKTTNSNIGISMYGVPAGHPMLYDNTAMCFVDSLTINGFWRRIEHASIYITNDQGPIHTYTFSKELARAEVLEERSIWTQHLMVYPTYYSQVYIISKDEANLITINTKLRTGTDWRKYIDTIRTINNIKEIPGETPQTYQLGNNYPNPFNNTTNIPIKIAEKSMVTIKTYNILGQEIDTIIEKELEQGNYNIQYTINKPTGTYIIQMTTKNREKTYKENKKILLIK